jgi:nitrate reductase NapAB chaperone NapD
VKQGRAVDAFILIQAEQGKVVSVLEHVRPLEGVVDAQMVAGPYDVIARVRIAENLDLLQMTRIRRLEGVLRVLASQVVLRQSGQVMAHEAHQTRRLRSGR